MLLGLVTFAELSEFKSFLIAAILFYFIAPYHQIYLHLYKRFIINRLNVKSVDDTCSVVGFGVDFRLVFSENC